MVQKAGGSTKRTERMAAGATAAAAAPPPPTPVLPSFELAAAGCGLPSTGKPCCRCSSCSRSDERALIGRAHALAPGVVPRVALGELRKLPGEHGKEAVPRRGAEPERRPDHVAGARRLRRAHQSGRAPARSSVMPGRIGATSSPAWMPAAVSRAERPDPRLRHRRARARAGARAGGPAWRARC